MIFFRGGEASQILYHDLMLTLKRTLQAPVSLPCCRGWKYIQKTWSHFAHLLPGTQESTTRFAFCCYLNYIFPKTKSSNSSLSGTAYCCFLPRCCHFRRQGFNLESTCRKSISVQFLVGNGCFQNRGTPKSSIWIGFSVINHPFWGTPIFGNTQIFSVQIEISQCKPPGLYPFEWLSGKLFSGGQGLVESRVAGVASWPCLFHSVYVYPRNITFWTQKWRFGRCISFSNSMLVFWGEGNSTTKLFGGILISHSSNRKVECHVRVLNAAHIGIQTSRWIISFKIEVCHFSKAMKCHVFLHRYFKVCQNHRLQMCSCWPRTVSRVPTV